MFPLLDHTAAVTGTAGYDAFSLCGRGLIFGDMVSVEGGESRGRGGGGCGESESPGDWRFGFSHRLGRYGRCESR